MDLMTKYLNQNCLKILSERFIENVKNRFNLLERLRVIKCNENKLIEQTRIYKKNSDFLISISLQPNIVDLWYFKFWILLNKSL